LKKQQKDKKTKAQKKKLNGQLKKAWAYYKTTHVHGLMIFFF
jgi:hypothetical protein